MTDGRTCTDTCARLLTFLTRLLRKDVVDCRLNLLGVEVSSDVQRASLGFVVALVESPHLLGREVLDKRGLSI